MGASNRRVVIVVRPGRSAGSVQAWLRQLLPAAVLLVSPGTVPPESFDAGDAIVVDAEGVDSPLALADAIARGSRGSSLGDGWRPGFRLEEDGNLD